jgi:hypothetical protein
MSALISVRGLTTVSAVRTGALAVKAAVPHLRPGSSIIGSSSVNSVSASDDGSYISGACVPVTGGRPVL